MLPIPRMLRYTYCSHLQHINDTPVQLSLNCLKPPTSICKGLCSICEAQQNKSPKALNRMVTYDHLRIGPTKTCLLTTQPVMKQKQIKFECANGNPMRSVKWSQNCSCPFLSLSLMMLCKYLFRIWTRKNTIEY